MFIPENDTRKRTEIHENTRKHDKENMKNRKKETTIFFETGERFVVESRVATPVKEALRVYSQMKKAPGNTSTDILDTAKILLVLAGINF